MSSRSPYARRVFLLAAASALVAAWSGAPDARQQPPDFVSGIELVAVDFRALTGTGDPVTDLTPDDISLKVGNRPRTLHSLQWIQVAPTAPSVDDVWIPPPFGSNAASDAGPAVIIVLDNESLQTGREAPLRRAVNRFLSVLSPRDRVALVTMPYGGLKVDFTNEHGKVTQALAAISGQAMRTESGSDAACRTRRTLAALAALLEGLGNPEAPTTFMFFTTGLAGPRRDAPLTLAPGPCELTPDHFQQVGAAAITARSQFYVIQPEDPALRLSGSPTENIAGRGFAGSDNPLEGIEHLSGVTGARRLHLATAEVAKEQGGSIQKRTPPDSGQCRRSIGGAGEADRSSCVMDGGF